MRNELADSSDAPTVALPEARQLDVLAGLLESRNVGVVRCPMIAIRDAPDSEPIVAWITRFIQSPPDLLIIYTGEGVQRLLGFAEGAGVEPTFVATLKKTALLTRGPKPVQALRGLGIKPTYEAAAPTTAGVITTLETMDLDDKRIGVQLYGTDPNETLMSYLRSRGVTPDCVAPYVYASETDDAAVGELIMRMHKRDVDAIAFTSKSQFERLQSVANRLGLASELESALASITVAAVGPVVARELEDHGVRVDVVPSSNFHMKPLVRLLVDRIGAGS